MELSIGAVIAGQSLTPPANKMPWRLTTCSLPTDLTPPRHLWCTPKHWAEEYQSAKRILARGEVVEAAYRGPVTITKRGKRRKNGDNACARPGRGAESSRNTNRKDPHYRIPAETGEYYDACSPTTKNVMNIAENVFGKGNKQCPDGVINLRNYAASIADVASYIQRSVAVKSSGLQAVLIYDQSGQLFYVRFRSDVHRSLLLLF